MNQASPRDTQDGVVVILTHEHADFDGVASQVGLSRLLPESLPVLSQHVNDNVRDFLVLYGRDLPLVDRDGLGRQHITHAWMVDTDAAQAVRGMRRETPRSVIDHHPADGDADDDHERWASADVQTVGATATLICERLREAQITPSPIEATLLLLGIHEDTGSLTYGGTTPRDVRAVAWLMEAGADLDVMGRFLHPPLSAAARAVYQQLLDAAERRDMSGYDVVITLADASELEETVSGLVHRVVEALGPDALFALVDVGSHVQLVARSTNAGIDVSAVAEALGGGGHARAAAAVIDAPMADAQRRLENVLQTGLATEPAARVGDIMTHGTLRTLRPEQTVEEALRMARRHGHEGFPVVENERVIGLVTRATLDLAQHHHLHQQPVRELIASPPPVVAPGDSLGRLRRVMTRHDAGQVPVVADGRLVGVVTRTDVLAWQRDRRRAQHTTETTVSLAGALEDEQLAAIRELVALARRKGQRAYVVGGLPRDLLLERRSRRDVDLIVVGDAPALAEEAAKSLGGRAVAHGRFGTAKWQRDTIDIDLVTARAEYYAEPGALPTVSAGSLRADLRRRDFTINTLAVELEEERFGRVIDLFGGLDDLRSRRIRVLHGLSFVEDPTRILRAVRFEHRLGFRMDDHTERLARGAVSWLGRISGARITNELRQLLAEDDPVGALDRLRALGALHGIHDGLRWDGSPRRALLTLPAAWQRWRRLPAGRELSELPDPRARLLAWLAAQADGGAEAARRLRLGRRDRQLLRAAWHARNALRALGSDGPPSTVYQTLEPLDALALLLLWICVEDDAVRRHVRNFAAAWCRYDPPLNGQDVLALGFEPGPVVGHVLRDAHEALLDGHVADREEALSLARQLRSVYGRRDKP